MMKSKFAFALLLSLATSPLLAFEGIADNPKVINEKSMGELKELLKGVKGIKGLPGSGLNMIETKNGDVFLVTNNGRYVIHEPEVVDTWNGRVLTSVDDLQDIDRINLKLMRLKLSDLASFAIGKAGLPQVAIFIDPYCPYCDKLIKQTTKLADKYRFVFVMTPILGDRSFGAAHQLLCMPKEKATKIITDSLYRELKAEKAKCSDEPLLRSLVVSQVLGIDSVPFTIMPSGRFTRGYVSDLQKAIELDFQKGN